MSPVRAAVTVLLCMLLQSHAGAEQPTGLIDDMPRAQIIVDTSASRCLLLDAWLAETPEQKSRGLMFIKHLDEFEGMLFWHSQPAKLTMWMKNTFIPLDMVFLHADGEIAGIAANTTPHSTKRIQSPGVVAGVLEVNAGFSERWSLKKGNRILAVTKLN